MGKTRHVPRAAPPNHDGTGHSVQPRQQSPRLPQDQPIQFQRHQFRQNRRRRHIQITDQLILGHRTWPQPCQDQAVQRRRVAQGPLGRGRRRNVRRHRAQGWRHHADRLQNVMGRPHQHRSIADQSVAPRRPGVKRMPRHGEYLTALFQRRLCGDQRPRFRRRLDHHNRPRQARYDSVTLREMPHLRLHPHGLLGQAAPFGQYLGGQCSVFDRIDVIHPTRLHSHGAGAQRRLMRLGVHAARQPRHHDQPCRPQSFAQTPRHAQPQRRRRPRADQRNHRPRQQPHIALRPQYWRGIENFLQCGRIVGLAPAQHPGPRRPCRLHLGHHHAHRANLVILDPRRLGNPRQRPQRLGGRTVIRHHPVKGRRPDPPRPDQPQPILRVIVQGCRIRGCCLS